LMAASLVNGYPTVWLTYAPGKVRSRRVHILVLRAFVGPPPFGHESRHLDGNPANPRLDNLCWGTHKENEADKKVHGTRLFGECAPWSKLTDTDVLKIRELAAMRVEQKEIAKMYNIRQSTVSKIHLRVRWKHV
jgi:hypothetical protein